MRSDSAGVTEREWLMEVLQGCEDAVELCVALGSVSQVWDDLVDEGRSDHVSEAFLTALVEIPANPFYRAHFDQLHPVISMACFDYLAAQRLERGTPHERVLSFSLRDSYAAIVVQCAALIGGIGYGAAQSARIRMAVHDEPLSAYLGGLRP